MGTEAQVSIVDYGLRFLRSVHRWWVPAPLIAGALAYVGLRVGFDDMSSLLRIREIMEQAAMVMTCAAALVALVRLAVQRRPLALWLLLLAGLIAFREWHIVPWASTLAYVGVAALFVAAWLNDEPLGRHVTAHPVSTLIVLAFLSYAITRPLDMSILQNIAPQDDAAMAPLPFVEEVVENFGHACLLVLVLVARERP